MYLKEKHLFPTLVISSVPGVQIVSSLVSERRLEQANLITKEASDLEKKPKQTSANNQ